MIEIDSAKTPQKQKVLEILPLRGLNSNSLVLVLSIVCLLFEVGRNKEILFIAIPGAV